MTSKQLSNRPRPDMDLHTGLASLYQTKAYSDLSLFDRDGSEHRLHKAIVCPRSSFLQGAVAESRWKDGNVDGVFLSEQADVVKMIVEYLYLSDYKPTTPIHEDSIVRTDSHSSGASSIRSNAASYGQIYGTSAVCAFGGPSYQSRGPDTAMSAHALPLATLHDPMLLQAVCTQSVTIYSHEPMGASYFSSLADTEAYLTLHLKVYTGAVKYGIAGLKTLALKKLNNQLDRHYDSPEFVKVIETVCSSDLAGDANLRKAVLSILSRHPLLLEKAEIDYAVKACNSMPYELLKRIMRIQLGKVN